MMPPGQLADSFRIGIIAALIWEASTTIFPLHGIFLYTGAIIYIIGLVVLAVDRYYY